MGPRETPSPHLRTARRHPGRTTHAVVLDGRTVTATVQANWGEVTVTSTAPVAHLRRCRDRRCWSFAVACFHRPDYRYALHGTLTPRGREIAEQLLTALYRDWQAVAHHGAALEAACRHARQDLADLERDHAARGRLRDTERAALRRAFKAGDLTPQDFQRRLLDLRAGDERRGRERYEAQERIRQEFADRARGLCGRPLALDEAEWLLADGAVVVGEGP
jgi:hypothetical protein